MAWHSADEETWYHNMENDLGMNVRPKAEAE
jgi:hypothetical protein